MRTASDRRAMSLMLLAAAGWPLIESVGGLLMSRHSPYQVVTLRYSAHLVLLLPLALLHSGFRVFRTRRLGLQLLRGFSMFLMPVVFVAGSRTAGAAWVWSAFWCILALVLLGARLLGERPVPSAWIVVAVGFVGSWFARGSPTGGFAAAGFGVASALCFGGYIVLSRVLRQEDLATSLVYTAIGALVPTLVLAAPVWVPLDTADILPALGLGALSLCILGSIDLSLEESTLSRAVPWLVVVPALEVAAGGLLGHGLPGRRALFGSALVLAAFLLWTARSEGVFPFRTSLREFQGAG